MATHYTLAYKAVKRTYCTSERGRRKQKDFECDKDSFTKCRSARNLLTSQLFLGSTESQKEKKHIERQLCAEKVRDHRSRLTSSLETVWMIIMLLFPTGKK